MTLRSVPPLPNTTADKLLAWLGEWPSPSAKVAGFVALFIRLNPQYKNPSSIPECPAPASKILAPHWELTAALISGALGFGVSLDNLTRGVDIKDMNLTGPARAKLEGALQSLSSCLEREIPIPETPADRILDWLEHWPSPSPKMRGLVATFLKLHPEWQDLGRIPDSRAPRNVGPSDHWLLVKYMWSAAEEGHRVPTAGDNGEGSELWNEHAVKALQTTLLLEKSLQNIPDTK